MSGGATARPRWSPGRLTFWTAHLVLTDVGTFTNSASYYGAFDMSGNVYAWNDLDGTTGSSRGLRGGVWGDVSASNLSSSGGGAIDPSFENDGIGFRLAAVPEPSTYAMAFAGIVCGGFSMWRRRKRVGGLLRPLGART